MLMNPIVPVIFKAVDGIYCQNENNTSRFNMAEVTAIVTQINKLLEFKLNQKKIKCIDIGVMSPYKLQCEIIRNLLCTQKKYDGITIGTAEIFQQMKKPIMLISTVCIDEELGFVNVAQVIYFSFFFLYLYILNNYYYCIIKNTKYTTKKKLIFFKSFQHINAVPTEKNQSLLIIFGDPKVLIKNSNWLYLLEFCGVNKTFEHIKKEKLFKFPKSIKIEGNNVSKESNEIEKSFQNIYNENTNGSKLSSTSNSRKKTKVYTIWSMMTRSQAKKLKSTPSNKMADDDDLLGYLKLKKLPPSKE